MAPNAISKPVPSKRDYLLPPRCKDLIDALQRRPKVVAAAPYPPVTRQVTLREKVSVRYLAEISGKELYAIFRVMAEMRVNVSPNRSVDFADAQKILRRCGIWAARGATNV